MRGRPMGAHARKPPSAPERGVVETHWQAPGGEIAEATAAGAISAVFQVRAAYSKMAASSGKNPRPFLALRLRVLPVATLAACVAGTRGEVQAGAPSSMVRCATQDLNAVLCVNG